MLGGSRMPDIFPMDIRASLDFAPEIWYHSIVSQMQMLY